MTLSIGFSSVSLPPDCYPSYGASGSYPGGTDSHGTHLPYLDALVGTRAFSSSSCLGYAGPMEQTAKFFVGQIVHHKKFDYRGVVFDVDATFQGTDEWYTMVARSRPPKDMPWYHVLVDGAEHTTYVAERHLESDERGKPITHPLVAELCGEFQEGRYFRRSRLQ